MLVESAKIYREPTLIPLDPSATRVLVGGDFDDLGQPHAGHIAGIRAASNLDFLAQYNTELRNRLSCLPRNIQLICAITKRPRDKMRPLRPILPYYAKMKNIAGLEPVSFVYPTTGNLEYDIETYFNLLPPHILVASETTTNLYASWRQQSWDNLRRKHGITIVVLPKLVDTSTTQELSKFFHGAEQIKQLNVDFDEEGYFPLFFAEELSSPPDMAVVNMARQTAKEITGKNCRILEFNSGSGAFNAVVALHSPPDSLSLVRTVSEDQISLGISALNIKRASLFAMRDQSILEFSQSSGWLKTHGTYDVIYANAKDDILSELTHHVRPGSKAILRLPIDYDQALRVRNLIFSYVNDQEITIQEQIIDNGRFIILRFA